MEREPRTRSRGTPLVCKQGAEGAVAFIPNLPAGHNHVLKIITFNSIPPPPVPASSLREVSRRTTRTLSHPSEPRLRHREQATGPGKGKAVGATGLAPLPGSTRPVPPPVGRGSSFFFLPAPLPYPIDPRVARL